MAERKEQPQPLGIFEQLIKLAEKISKEKQIPIDEAKPFAVDEFRIRQAKNINVEQTKANKFKEKIESESPEINEEARQEVRSQAYTDKDIIKSKKLLEDFPTVKTKTPFEINPEAIESNKAIEVFVTRVGFAPENLQKNPNFIQHEVARLYYSTEWTSLSDEGYRQTQQTIQNALKYAQDNSPAQTIVSKDDYYALIDKRVNIYRTNRPEPIPGVQEIGEPPLKFKGKPENHEYILNTADPRHEEWMKNTTNNLHQKQLNEYLRDCQDDLDRLEGKPFAQEKYLVKMYDNLTTGYQGGFIKEQIIGKTSKGENFDISVMIIKKFDKEQAQRHMDVVQERQVTMRNINKQNQLKEQQENNIIQEIARTQRKEEEEKVLIRETGMGIVYDVELDKIVHNPQRKIGDILPFHRDLQFSSDEWALLKQGEEGWREFVARFRREKTERNKPFHIDLPDMNKWENVKNIIKWVGGDKETEQIVSQLDAQLHFYENTDSIVKGVDQMPKKKVEDFTNPERWLNTQILEQLRQFPLLELAKPHFRNSIMYFMHRDSEEYMRALETLMKSEQNPLLAEQIAGNDIQNTTYKNLLEQGHDHHAPIEAKRKITGNEYVDLIYKGETYIEQYDKWTHESDTSPNYKDHQKELKKMKPAEKAFFELYSSLSAEQRAELVDKRDNLLQTIDRVGSGVLLRDEHMLPRWVQYDELYQYYNQHIQLQKENPNNPELAAMEKKMNALWSEITMNPNSKLKFDDIHEVELVRGLSPVEIETQARVISQMKLEEQTRLKQENPSLTNEEVKKRLDEHIKTNEWKIHEAVWSARSLSIGMGEAMELAAKLGRSSSIDLRYKVGRKTRVEHFMDRGWAEAWVRVINPALFADDFTMGGPLGDEIRNLKYLAALKFYGYDYTKEDNFDEYKEKIRKGRERHPPIPEWVILMEYAEKELGMSYSEVVRPELLATGLQNLSSTWRMEKAASDKIRDDYILNNKPGDGREYHAFGLQLMAAETTEERIGILKKMMRKTPSEFISLIDTKDMTTMCNELGIRVSGSEWESFQRAITIAEMELTRNEAYKFSKFDFTNETQFNEVMPKAFEAVTGQKAPDLSKYRELLNRVCTHMESVDVGRKYSRLERWADHKFKQNFMLGMSQLDWKKDVNFTKIGLFSLERRINDFNGQYTAANLEREIYYAHPELYFFPVSGKEPDALAKIAEYREAIVSYSGYEDAESAQYIMLDTMINWNKNRAAFTAAGWVPGAVSVMRRMPQIASVGDSIKGGVAKTIGFFGGKDIQEKLENTPMSHWPKSVAGAVSYDVKWGGPEGNAWDEYKIAGLLTTAEDLKMFRTEKGEKLLKKLFSDHKSTAFQRWFVGIPRKYWWVVPVATISVALSSSAEEEKKSGGHH